MALQHADLIPFVRPQDVGQFPNKIIQNSHIDHIETSGHIRTFLCMCESLAGRGRLTPCDSMEGAHFDSFCPSSHGIDAEGAGCKWQYLVWRFPKMVAPNYIDHFSIE